MNVAIVVDGEDIGGGGGAERRFLRLWRYLSEGPKPALLVTNEKLLASAVEAGALATGWPRDLVEVVDRAGGLARSMGIYRSLRARGVRLAHLVLARRSHMPLYLRLAAQNRIAVVHTVASSQFTQRGRAAVSVLATSAILWRAAKRIDTLYPAFVTNYAEPWGFEEKVRVSPCSFTDAERFSPAMTKLPEMVFAGRLIAEKNPLLFLDAAGRVLESHPEWSATLAGTGVLHREVQCALEAKPWRARMHLGAVPDLAPILARSSLFVSLQQTENYPSQALLEAMLAENAVIASDVGETARLVRHESTGLLVDLNPASVAAAIERVCNSPGLRARLGKQARALVLAEHTIERFAEYIIGVWGECIA